MTVSLILRNDRAHVELLRFLLQYQFLRPAVIEKAILAREFHNVLGRLIIDELALTFKHVIRVGELKK